MKLCLILTWNSSLIQEREKEDYILIVSENKVSSVFYLGHDGIRKSLECMTKPREWLNCLNLFRNLLSKYFYKLIIFSRNVQWQKVLNERFWLQDKTIVENQTVLLWGPYREKYRTTYFEFQTQDLFLIKTEALYATDHFKGYLDFLATRKLLLPTGKN